MHYNSPKLAMFFSICHHLIQSDTRIQAEQAEQDSQVFVMDI